MKPGAGQKVYNIGTEINADCQWLFITSKGEWFKVGCTFFHGSRGVQYR